MPGNFGHCTIVSLCGRKVYSFGIDRVGELGNIEERELEQRKSASCFGRIVQWVERVVLDHTSPLPSYYPEVARISFDIRIVCVSSGYDHSMAVGEDGSLWGWGGNFFGQLCLKNRGSLQKYPEEVHLPLGYKPTFTSVSCSCSWTLALDSDGIVWGFGRNDIGQLGHNDTREQITARAVEDIPRIAIISTSENRSVVLDVHGCVWYFGRDISVKHASPSGPDKMLGIEGIVSIASGDDHTLALNKVGEVWSVGCGSLGQLGLGDRKYRGTPQKIEGIPPIARIWCGAESSYIQDHEGRMLVFGSEPRPGCTPRVGTQDLPHENTQLRDAHIIPGPYHAVAVAKNGTASFFGLFTDKYGLPLPTQPKEDLGVCLGARNACSTKSARTAL